MCGNPYFMTYCQVNVIRVDRAGVLLLISRRIAPCLPSPPSTLDVQRPLNCIGKNDISLVRSRCVTLHR